ncbi:MAG: hypothetical protein K2I06_01595 [Ruminococcus sp.]|nr:hypothetical protein [Ruminococcus sp.]
MLFVQYISLFYGKDVRYANYANVRNSLRFAPIVTDKIPDCEVLYQKIFYRQYAGGMEKYHDKIKTFGKEIFTAGNRDLLCGYEKLIHHTRIFREDDRYKIMFCNDSYYCFNGHKRRGHNEGFFDKSSPFCHRDLINETAFTLKTDEYGRIIYNDRYVEYDSGQWYYGLHTINFINCDKSKYREKMFFRKIPDYEYKNMQYLRYC